MREHSTKGWTYSEFARLPGDQRYEVIRGEVFGTKTPSLYHQIVLMAVLMAVNGFVEDNKLGEAFLGPLDVLFGDGDYAAPDFLFVRRERVGMITDRGVECAPDLIVEVASPATIDRDRGIKREMYAHYGVPHYWIVNPDEHVVEVYRILYDPVNPAVVARESFTWQPQPGGPVLEVDVPDLFDEMDEMLRLHQQR